LSFWLAERATADPSHEKCFCHYNTKSFTMQWVKVIESGLGKDYNKEK